MSIFTRLRHPITIDFHIHDLENLPPSVLAVWWYRAGRQGTSAENRRRIPSEPARVHAYLNHSTSKQNRVMLLNLLKSMLDERDNQ
jgi:hypothetical protein